MAIHSSESQALKSSTTEAEARRLRILSRAGLKAVVWEEGESLKSAGDMVFCSLHHHTTFSYLDGFGTPAQHSLRAAEMGMYALAVTDHGNVTAHVQHEQACDKHGVKPLFGCEFYCGDIGEERTMKKNHLTVLAENQTGYANLLRLVSQAWYKGFYYQPTIDGALLKEYCDGLVVLSGCQGSLLSTSLTGGKNIEVGDASYPRAKAVAARFKRLLGDAYYLEVQAFPELEKTNNINVGLAKMSRELGIPLVASLDAHYTTPDEGQMQAILHSVRSGGKKTAEELDQTWGYDIPLCPLSDKDIYKRLVRTGLSKAQAEQAIRNSREIAQRCTVRLPKVTNLRYPLPPGVPDNLTLFRKLVNDGWKYRGFRKLDPVTKAEYIARVKYEMELIEEKQFVDYFLVMADVTVYAKDSGIPVGPARGSAAASLVCYILRITEVNPMHFPVLVFERFMDKNRHDPPDIDLDFDDEKRYLIREYLADKYGGDRVGSIGTFIKYKGKNSLNDVQMALYRDNWACRSDLDTVKDLLIERKSGDLRPDATVEDTIEMFPQVADIFKRWPNLLKAQRLEGNVRGMSVHAAGLVVANAPLTDFCAIYSKTDSKGGIKLDPETGEPLQVISLDKYDVEYLGALKLDLLGLKTMAMIRICLEQIGMTLEELYNLPLDDKETLLGFREQDVTGIFQFDGRATRQVNSGVKPDNFMEVADINALSRPGPLHSGATGDYIDVKFDRKPAVRFNDIVDGITKHTQYQIVYQEQILQICRELGEFSYLEAGRVRRIISKKRGEQEFNKLQHKFVEGAATHGMEEADAIKVWSLMATAGAYAFCLTGDAVVQTGGRGSSGGATYTMKQLWEAYNHPDKRNSLRQKLRYGQRGKRITLQQMDGDGRVRPRQFLSIDRSPITQPIYMVTLENGMSFKGTGVHRVLTTHGYTEIFELGVGDDIICEDTEYQYKQPSKVRTEPRKSTYDNSKKGFEKGSGNPSWIDGRTGAIREAEQIVLDRSGNKCESCGAVGSGGKHDLEFAHVVGLTDLGGDYLKYHTPDNILRLCNSCHKKFDYSKGERLGRDSVGKPTVSSGVVSIVSMDEMEYVYMIEMNDNNHNYIANGVVMKNNAAHCVSYGLLAYWTMWLKRHYPREFFIACLRKFDDKQLSLLRDALSHDIPHSSIGLDSEITWSVGGRGIQAGWLQVPGIGEVKARAITDFLRDADNGTTWKHLSRISGIGPKTVTTITDFAEEEDPFGVHRLKKKLHVIRTVLNSGVDMIDEDGRFRSPGQTYRLPAPTATSEDIPYDKTETDFECVWLGVIKYRNLKDLFEVHHSKTGEVLDPNDVKRPDLNEWVTMEGEDETGTVHISVNRFVYNTWRDDVWSIDIENDAVLIKGKKWHGISRRMLSVNYLWVLED